MNSADIIEILHYRTVSGADPYEEWLAEMDRPVIVRIEAHVSRMARGNFGQSRSVGNSVIEMLRGGLLEKKMKPTISHEEVQIARFRRDPDQAVSYLNACMELAFEDDDPGLVMIALSTVARAFGISQLARETGLRRESLHRILTKKGNPEWSSVFRIFRALHLRPRVDRIAA